MKKRLSFSLIIVSALFLFQLVALAQAATSTPSDEPLTWAYILTLPGCVAVTLLIVQYTKSFLDQFAKIPTQLYVLILSVGLQILATAYTSGLTVAAIPLIILNSFLVATSAMGTYDVTYKKADLANSDDATG